jgi:hypothetical protein
MGDPYSVERPFVSMMSFTPNGISESAPDPVGRCGGSAANAVVPCNSRLFSAFAIERD